MVKTENKLIFIIRVCGHICSYPRETQWSASNDSSGRVTCHSCGMSLAKDACTQCPKRKHRQKSKQQLFGRTDSVNTFVFGHLSVPIIVLSNPMVSAADVKIVRMHIVLHGIRHMKIFNIHLHGCGHLCPFPISNLHEKRKMEVHITNIECEGCDLNQKVYCKVCFERAKKGQLVRS